MHVAGKVFIGLGVLFIVLGLVMAGGGRESLGDVGEWSVEDKSAWSGAEGTATYLWSGDPMMVMVRDNVRCDTFSLTMTNDTGESHYKNDECTYGNVGQQPAGYSDDPDGWYHMGTITDWEYTAGEYTIVANSDFELVPMWEIVGEELGEAAGGLMGILGGIGLSGCGVCFLVLGGILALVLNDPKEATQIQHPPSD